MILLHEYQERVATLPKATVTIGTRSMTNVRSEHADEDARGLSQTKTLTETRREHTDQDAALAAQTQTATLVRNEQADRDAAGGSSFNFFPR